MHERTITRFWATCDGCNAAAPEADTRQDARDAAFRRGWERYGSLDALLCPRCYLDWEEQQARAVQWEAERDRQGRQ